MTKLLIPIFALFAALPAQAILILPYGHWTLTDLTCESGSRANPGMSRGSRYDLHIQEKGTFEIAILRPTDWTVMRGPVRVDHATATLCLQPTESIESEQPLTTADDGEMCMTYSKPNDQTLVLVRASGGGREDCPKGDIIRLRFRSME